MEEIRDIVGETVSDKRMAETIMDNDYDLQKSLDILLNEPAPTSRSRPIKMQVDPIEKGNEQKNLPTKFQFQLTFAFLFYFFSFHIS